jgi:hypothetical protein
MAMNGMQELSVQRELDSGEKKSQSQTGFSFWVFRDGHDQLPSQIVPTMLSLADVLHFKSTIILHQTISGWVEVLYKCIRYKPVLTVLCVCIEQRSPIRGIRKESRYCLLSKQCDWYGSRADLVQVVDSF